MVLADGIIQEQSLHFICHSFPMCGRYRLSRRKQMVEEYLSLSEMNGPGSGKTLPLLSLFPSFANIPKEPVRQLSPAVGRQSSWAKDMSGAATTVNAGGLGSRNYEACLPRCIERSPVPDPSGSGFYELCSKWGKRSSWTVSK